MHSHYAFSIQAGLISPPATVGLLYALIALFMTVYPVFCAWDARRLRRRLDSMTPRQRSAARLRDYRQAIALLWLATALVAGLVAAGELTLESLALIPRS
ncbi:MAG: hypothetical protein AAF368_02620, partial [Planctomycetota bacterium]